MTTPALIRPAGWRDIGAVSRIQRASFRRGLAYSRLTLTMLWALPPIRFLVAESDGHVVGGIIADRDPLRGTVRILNLAVDPDHRRRGIGSLLLHETDRRMPAKATVLTVDAFNDAARALYLREGFVETGRRRNYYGPGRHGVIMTRFRTG